MIMPDGYLRKSEYSVIFYMKVSKSSHINDNNYQLNIVLYRGKEKIHSEIELIIY